MGVPPPEAEPMVDEAAFSGRGGAFALLGFGIKRKAVDLDKLADDEDGALAAELAGDGAGAVPEPAFEDEGVEDELAALLAQGEEPEEEFAVDADEAAAQPAAKRPRASTPAGDEDEDDLVDLPAEDGEAGELRPAAKSLGKGPANRAPATPPLEDEDEEVEIEIDEAEAAEADELAQAAASEVKAQTKGKGKGKKKGPSAKASPEDMDDEEFDASTGKGHSKSRARVQAAEAAVDDDWDEESSAKPAGKAAGKAGKAGKAGNAGKAGKAGKAGQASGVLADEDEFNDVFDDDDKWKALSKGKGKSAEPGKCFGGKMGWGKDWGKGFGKWGGPFKGKGFGKQAAPVKEPETVEEWTAAQDRLFGHMEKLPDGWIRMKSRSKGTIYFYSTKTGESRDTAPSMPLPMNWQVMTSKSSGQTYYYNSKTGQSQFEKPLY